MLLKDYFSPEYTPYFAFCDLRIIIAFGLFISLFCIYHGKGTHSVVNTALEFRWSGLVMQNPFPTNFRTCLSEGKPWSWACWWKMRFLYTRYHGSPEKIDFLRDFWQGVFQHEPFLKPYFFGFYHSCYNLNSFVEHSLLSLCWIICYLYFQHSFFRMYPY